MTLFTYWMSFRLHNVVARDQRYERLSNGLNRLSPTPIWMEPTSLLVFQSEAGIDDVAAVVKAAIYPQTDLAIVGMMHFRPVRVIGRCTDASIFNMVPDARVA
jgi:hypothetical protein